MKKIIIAVFIVIATLGIAAGTTAKKTTSKTTTVPKKVVTDPYVGWWFHAYDESLEEYTVDWDSLDYITKENGEYFSITYQYFEKTTGAKLCKAYNGQNKYKIDNIQEHFKEQKFKRATQQQVDNLKYNIKNANWLKPGCEE